MLKHVAACVLALSALSANAVEQTFQFTYTGAMTIEGTWLPMETTGGKFIVDDLNGDGVFTLPEVKWFSYDPAPVENCGKPNMTCTLSSFQYDPKGDLFLEYRSAERVGNGSPPFDGGWISDSINVTPTYKYWGHYFDLGEGDYDTYIITPETKFSITAVPEPQTYLMMAAGLLALGASARRARRSS